VKLIVVACFVMVAGLALYELAVGTVDGTVKGTPCLHIPCQRPMAGVQLRFVAEVAGWSTATTTTTGGRFQARLFPGKYRLDVYLGAAHSHVLEGPQEVTVLPRASTHIDLLIPSGLL
jgi:hypothetical protein